VIATKEMKLLLCQRQPFFRDLYAEATSSEERASLLGKVVAVDDSVLEVVELTGAPGDVYFMDLRTLHAGAPNAAERPRMMATCRFVRMDVLQELTKAFGWK
jgi:ectoine hydroxylase-related dioxygenase (phytanoyl-CoA dioxygenase family)